MLSQRQVKIDEDVAVGIESSGGISYILIRDQRLEDLLSPLLARVPVSVKVDKPDQSEINLPKEVDEISNKVFRAIQELQTELEDECLAAFVASHYYERFTQFWNALLQGGHHVLAACLWLRLLRHTWDWESKHPPFRIHKGTPYHFLASTLFRLGDIDTGFTYLYNAVEESRKLAQPCPRLKYPRKAPSYLTASLLDDKDNYMYPLFVKDLREVLSKYISDYNSDLGKNFTINEFQNRFLENPKLEDVRFFFNYNIWVLNELLRKTEPFLRRNPFSKLRNLDIVFNLCLVIDKVLENKYGGETMWSNIIGICRDRGWMQKTELENKDFRKLLSWEKDLSKFIPPLLQDCISYDGKPIRREVLQLLIAYKLRNYGGHRIQQQEILVDSFEKIVSVLMNCLFIAVEANGVPKTTITVGGVD